MLQLKPINFEPWKKVKDYKAGATVKEDLFVDFKVVTGSAWNPPLRFQVSTRTSLQTFEFSETGYTQAKNWFVHKVRDVLSDLMTAYLSNYIDADQPY